MKVKMYFLLMAVLFLCGPMVQAQPVPKMWVSEKNSQDRTNQFNTGIYGTAGKSKEDVLTGIIGPAHPTGYTYAASAMRYVVDAALVDDRIGGGKGLRVYIVAYNPAYPATGVDLSWVMDKQLLLIFAPAVDVNKPDVGKYYFINPKGGNLYLLDPATVQKWADYYTAQVDNPTGLLKTIDLTDGNNIIPGTTPPVYSDTRCIYYDTADVVAFLETEADYQANHSRKPDHILVNFAAYTAAGGPRGKYVNRLIVLFEFVMSNNIIYIDDTPGFCQRTGAPVCKILLHALHGEKVVAIQSVRGGDNGQLCPPNCPCLIPPCH